MKPKRQMDAGGISLHSEQVSVGKPAVAKCCKSMQIRCGCSSLVFKRFQFSSSFPSSFPSSFRACVALHALRHEGNPASFQPECFPYADLLQRWTLQCIDPEKMQTHNKGLTPGLGEHEYLRWAAVRGSSHPRYPPLWLFRIGRQQRHVCVTTFCQRELPRLNAFLGTWLWHLWRHAAEENGSYRRDWASFGPRHGVLIVLGGPNMVSPQNSKCKVLPCLYAHS